MAAAALLALATVAAAPAATALPGDGREPIEITADRAVRDEKEGITVYTGNVEIRQGSLFIAADEVSVYRLDAEADRIVALGSPARMQQRPDVDDAMVYAWARRIEYFKAEQRINLYEEAVIEQEGSSVAGDEIEYLIDQELVTADSRGDSGDSRVKVFIPAERVPQTGEDSDGAADSE